MGEGHLVEAVEASSLVVVAWGVFPKAIDRARRVETLIRSQLAGLGRAPNLWCIGAPNDAGHPKHPLMLAYALPLTLWTGYP